MVKHILVFTRYFAPVYEASGPIQSVLSMASACGPDYRFSVLTSASDPRKPTIHAEVVPDIWQEYQGIQIYYASHGKRGWRDMRACIQQAQPDLLYSQSFFDPIFTALPLALAACGAVPKIPRLIAPRGEFSAAARAISACKKTLYMMAMKPLLRSPYVHIHATSEEEQQAAMALLGMPATRVHVANNIKAMAPHHFRVPEKKPGAARFAYLGRIAPIKNLHLALQFLAQQDGSIDFDVYGPADNDLTYWQQCQRMIATMPPHIRVNVHGVLDPALVTERLRMAHFFLLPTGGENFGHAILEALHAGLPALISDQTPHLHHHADAGWALPLEGHHAWHEAIKTCIEMDNAAYQGRVRAAQHYAQQYAASSTAVADHFAMFEQVIAT
jgi:glycosyltransferase involved in cell wall biosynthesis